MPLATDWDLCALCQCKTKETLQCPSKAKQKGKGSTYVTLAEKLLLFQKLGEVTSGVIKRLDEGGGITETFKKNEACFHLSCRLKFNATKFSRIATKRTSTDQDIDISEPIKKVTRNASDVSFDSANKNEYICFLCDKTDTEENLRFASTFQLDEKLRKCACLLQDSKLLATLSARDVISQELKYHSNCLVRLYRRAKPKMDMGELETDTVRHKMEIGGQETDKVRHGLVFAELTEFMQEVLNFATGDHMVVFKLADLVQMYTIRLHDFGLDSKRVHSCRLKHRLLAHFPDLQALASGRDVLLTFADHLISTLKEAYRESYDDEAVHLAKAARIVRRDLFSEKSEFTGSYDEHCQKSSVPETLLALMHMILQGPSIDTASSGKCQASLSLAQLASFNAVKTESGRARKNVVTTKHSRDRETPIPVYVGMTVHAQTRKKELVDSLFTLGLSISYKRVLEISSEWATKACKQFNQDRVVCPMKLRFVLFTTGAIDNIDHNPSSTTSKDSFHGTAISIFQHPTESCRGEERLFASETESNTTKGLAVPELPEFFTNVPPFAMKVPVEPSTGHGLHTMNNADNLYDRAVTDEYEWMEAVVCEDLSASECVVSWGAYHAGKERYRKDLTPGISGLLPLFHESSKSPAMIKHGIDMVKTAVQFLNPGQNPVIALDQPLFAVPKQIQWTCPDVYGENKVIVMLGGLHTEMALLKAVGTLLRESGWTDALIDAKLASSGVADSFLHVSHVTRTRHAHQVTVCALFNLMKKAYEQYLVSCTAMAETALSCDDWKMLMNQTSPTFHFWFLVMQMEILLLIFLASLRSGDFALYVESLMKMAPVFFALDQHNYARWLTVHIKDMQELHTVSPLCLGEFEKGHFVLQKSGRFFSKTALDQAHEQNNAVIKGDGGAVGLTENPSALRRWMIGGPEIARVIREFETSMKSSKRNPVTEHHEQHKSVQENFKTDVLKLVAVMQDAGNPFIERGADFVTLRKDIVSPVVRDSLQKLLMLGSEQYEGFIRDRFIDKTKKFSDPVKRNNLVMISGAKRKRKTANSFQISSLKNDCYLFSRLYIACQTRTGGLDDFFQYENQPTPPSLSTEQRMTPAAKSCLLGCLEHPQQPADSLPNMEVVILDGAAIVNMLRPGTARTFGSYATNVFLPYIQHSLQSVSRVDVVWDAYRADSLKSCTREERGKGTRKRVTSETLIPPNWSSFLRNDNNKSELFNYLAQSVITIETQKLIITTQGPVGLSNHPVDQEGLFPCSHEEADTRMMVHLAHAAEHYNRVLLRTVDTDVVVLAAAAVTRHPKLALWIAMGTGKDFRYISVNDIVRGIGTEKSCALPFFHSMGCDTVSSFKGISKKKAWDVWVQFDEVTETFLRLSTPTYELSLGDRAVLERFVVLLYDKTSNCLDVNSGRRHLFTKTGRQINHIPPTSEALLQHCKRAIYQGGHIWGQADNPMPVLPNPSDWGWQFVDGKWMPFWTSLPQASSTCQELLKCGCKKGCKSKRCKCSKAGLKCTSLCMCDCALTVYNPSS